jgi:hypothetical protein
VRQFPITAISSLKINEVAIPPTTSSVGCGYMFSGDAITLVGTYFTTGLQNVCVAYTAGCATIPSDLARACARQTAYVYRERTHLGLKSENIQQQTQSYQTDEWLPAVKNCLDRHKRLVVG